MKTLTIKRLTFTLFMAIALLVIPTKVYAASEDDVKTVTASGTESKATISGTTGENVAAVLIEIFDNDNQLITMETHPVNNKEFHAVIKTTLIKGQTYSAYVVNFNGNGTSSNGNFTVPNGSQNPPTPPTPPEDPKEEANKLVKAFVARMYTVALGREAEAKGLNDWYGQLINHTNDGAGLARGFICSSEFTNKKLSNEAYLNTLYKTFFDRTPDIGGKANWLSKLNRGTSRNEVLAGFVNSQEFANLCDKYGIARGTLEADGSSIYNAGVRNFVLRMYTKCLKRQGETVGVEDWTHRINKKQMTPEQVAKAFFNSPEFVNKKLNNEDYVETLYETFMGRASDAAGKADWVGKLNAGTSRQIVLEGFSRSSEFAKIMAEFGL